MYNATATILRTHYTCMQNNPTINKKRATSYRDAGVDIDAANQLIDTIDAQISSTHNAQVIGGLGGFGGLFALPTGYKQPVLVSGTDGVGTKLKLAAALQQHRTIGIDLVAMCVNDIITNGATPLFFLDYYATNKLDVTLAAQVIEGIVQGCQAANMALIGGETAEMPGMYAADTHYEMAGFAVGVVERDQIIDGRSVQPGHLLVGIESSGLHSNGYSLVHTLIAQGGHKLDQQFAESTLGETLLVPTKIYVNCIQQLQQSVPIDLMAHITGGGLLENVVRGLPAGCIAKIDLSSWRRPAIFDWLQTQSQLDTREMLRTFNCGIGMVLVLAPQYADQALRILQACGERAHLIGTIERAATENAPPEVVYTT